MMMRSHIGLKERILNFSFLEFSVQELSLEAFMRSRWIVRTLSASMLTFFLLILTTGSSPAQSAPDTTKKENVPTPAPKPGDTETTYRIGVEDELQISVWREPELSSLVVVRPDGKITLPLINDIVVTGLTPDELQTLLGQKLKTYVNEPQVTVTVRNIRSRKVYIVGQAVRQGSFPLNGTKTVLELIAEAGGLNPFAKSSSIYVLRTIDGKKTKIPFDYKKAISGKTENVVLMPGDVLVIP
jgi:polysaccharide export outer membrane protein